MPAHTGGSRATSMMGNFGTTRRASNTNPYLTLRFEGRTQAAVDDMKGQVFAALRRYPFVTLPD